MEQNRSYRSEATSDDSDSSTSSSSKKSATPRYQGAAYQPVAQPRSYDATYGGETSLPRAPLEAWIPLRSRIIQEQLDKQDAENKDEDSDNSTTTSAAKKPASSTAAAAHSRSEKEDTGAAKAPAASTPEQHSEAVANDEDKEDARATLAGQSPLQPAGVQHQISQEQSVSPPSEYAEQPLTAPHQEQAFTPPEEGIPTLSVPQEVPVAQVAESPLKHQWQSEAAFAFNDVPERPADMPRQQAGYDQQPPSPPIKPPAEASAFAQPPEYGGYQPNAYDSYRMATGPTNEYQPAPVAEHTRVIERPHPLVTPVLVGMIWYESRRRRAGDRREAASRTAADQALEKRLSTIASRRHEDVLRHQAAATERIHALQTEQHRQVHEQQRLREVQERFGAQPLMYGSERVQPAPAFAAERPAPPQGPEQHHTAEAVPGEPHTELTPEEALRQAQEQHERTRKVKSTWYETEVNAVTGQEVEGVVHGKGFHEERQQEIMRDRLGDASTDPVAASMGSYAVQAQGAPAYGMPQPALPSGLTTPALPQGTPTHADPQHQLKAGDSTVRSNVTNPWFWLMLGLILAAFFTAALI